MASKGEINPSQLRHGKSVVWNLFQPGFEQRQRFLGDGSCRLLLSGKDAKGDAARQQLPAIAVGCFVLESLIGIRETSFNHIKVRTHPDDVCNVAMNRRGTGPEPRWNAIEGSPRRVNVPSRIEVSHGEN